jgi:hypothetical protein
MKPSFTRGTLHHWRVIIIVTVDSSAYWTIVSLQSKLSAFIAESKIIHPATTFSWLGGAAIFAFDTFGTQPFSKIS